MSNIKVFTRFRPFSSVENDLTLVGIGNNCIIIDSTNKYLKVDGLSQYQDFSFDYVFD